MGNEIESSMVFALIQVVLKLTVFLIKAVNLGLRLAVINFSNNIEAKLLFVGS